MALNSSRTWGRGKPLRQIRVIQIVCVVDWLPLRDTSQSDLIVELGFYWCLHLFSPSRRLPNSSWSMCQLRDLELFISRRSMKELYWILFEFIGYDGQPYGPFTLGACPRNPNPDFFPPTCSRKTTPMIVGFNTSATIHHHLVVIKYPSKPSFSIGSFWGLLHHMTSELEMGMFENGGTPNSQGCIMKIGRETMRSLVYAPRVYKRKLRFFFSHLYWLSHSSPFQPNFECCLVGSPLEMATNTHYLE